MPHHEEAERSDCSMVLLHLRAFVTDLIKMNTKVHRRSLLWADTLSCPLVDMNYEMPLSCKRVLLQSHLVLLSGMNNEM